jgi:origin recognition complex subunit 5
VRYAAIQCQECLSQRHLLSKIFSACLTTLAVEEDDEQYDRIDTVNALAVGLEKLFRRHAQKLVLVLDEIDEQRGAVATLLPALARLGDLVHTHMRRKGPPY